MIGDKKVLAVIIARGGSKGLLRKNVLTLADRPMIAWSVAAARESSYVDRTVLSSDDDEIRSVAAAWGCDVPFVRPAELAADDASAESVVLHALDALETVYDYVVLLQATSPLRTGADIDAAIGRCRDLAAPACITVQVAPKSPYWMVTMDSEARLHRLLPSDGPTHRRQLLPSVYAPNGAVYVAEVPWFRANQRFLGPGTVGSLMPAERSIDVDTEYDLHCAEALLWRRKTPGPT